LDDCRQEEVIACGVQEPVPSVPGLAGAAGSRVAVPVPVVQQVRRLP
jgi:hypothetical protein